jgi:hypothetical protein
MKKLLIGLALLLTWSPYLFLATSIEDVKDSHRAYNCTVQSAGNIKEFFILADTYYTPIVKTTMLDGGRTILPRFFFEDEVSYAQCGRYAFGLGRSDFMKPGDKIFLYTRQSVVKFLGIVVSEYEGFHSASKGWGPDSKEGEVVAVVLIDGKEQKMFAGKILPEGQR